MGVGVLRGWYNITFSSVLVVLMFEFGLLWVLGSDKLVFEVSFVELGGGWLYFGLCCSGFAGFALIWCWISVLVCLLLGGFWSVIFGCYILWCGVLSGYLVSLCCIVCDLFDFALWIFRGLIVCLLV